MTSSSPEGRPRQVLILGGTAWLGGQLARAALERGCAVTCLARGESGPVPEGATLVKADRRQAAACDAVATQAWDAVIDLSSQPGRVRAAASALKQRCSIFVHVSSASVYASHALPDQDEDAAVLPPLEADEMKSVDEYGRAKLACERIVRQAVGDDRALIVRPGLIGGPGDVSDRSGYWPWRFAVARRHGREVLVPDEPQQLTQVIDVRDLARWIVDGAMRGLAGVFNATGAPTRLEDHLRQARAVAGHRGRLRPASSAWLSARGVAPWMGPRSLPLWLPMPDHAGFGARSSARAVDAGLRRRSLADTLADTLAWELARAPTGAARKAGLSDDDEDELLREWAQAGRQGDR